MWSLWAGLLAEARKDKDARILAFRAMARGLDDVEARRRDSCLEGVSRERLDVRRFPAPEIAPEPDQIIANIAALYADPEFLATAQASKSEISGYYSGISDYGNSQQEVVLELGSLERATIHLYGGFAETLDQLITEFNVQEGRPPDPQELALIQSFVGQPRWLSPEGTFAAISRTLGHTAARRWLPALSL